MLIQRLFEPARDQIVYHYCTAQSLQAILESRTLRFTDINMLNDAHEMKTGYSVFEEAVTRLVKRQGVLDTAPDIPVSFFDSVDEILSKVQLGAHPFVSCFSLDGDSLGQWRSYASDGQGFAIGFKAQALKQLLISQLAVEYEREQQVKEMMVALITIFLSKNKENKSKGDSFFQDCALTGVLMAGYKHPSFKHEREVRCLRSVGVMGDDHSIRFEDSGGQDSCGNAVKGSEVKFQVRDNHLCAYVDLSFSPPSGECPISEIVLGPKNYSAAGNVLLFVGGMGHANVTLRKSVVPYR